MFLPRLLPLPRLRLQRISRHKLHLGSLHTRLASTHIFKLADIGEGITECEVVKWELSPGSPVTQFQPIVHVQSDKATVELTSPYDGVLAKLLVEEGQVLKVGAGLCEIQVEEGPTEATSTDEYQVEQGNAKEPLVEAEQISLPLSSPQEKDTDKARKRHPLDPSSPLPQNTNILATPSTRHFARSKDVDLGLLVGTGKGGRIEKRDVEAFLAAPIPTTSPSSSPSPSSPIPSAVGDRTIPMSLARLGMFKSMTASLAIPHFGYTTSFDITQLHAALPRLTDAIPVQYRPGSSKSSSGSDLQYAVLPPAERPAAAVVEPEGTFVKMTYLPFLLNALARTMMEWPLFRTSLQLGEDKAKPTLMLRDTADVVIAMSTPTGLYTPLLPSLASSNHILDAYAIQSHLTSLSAKARAVPSKLSPKDMPGTRGGTFTISNIGSIGKGVTANPRLGLGGGIGVIVLGRAEWVWSPVFEKEFEGGKTPVPGNGKWMLMLPISVGADHRFVEGAEMAGFMEGWRGNLRF